METTSVKAEILKSLKELKDKGVSIIMHDEFLAVNEYSNGFTVMGHINTCSNAISCNGNCKGDKKPETIKKPSDFSIDIYQNSTEDQIKKQISDVKNNLQYNEEKTKTTAIVDFLKEQLN